MEDLVKCMEEVMLKHALDTREGKHNHNAKMEGTTSLQPCRDRVHEKGLASTPETFAVFLYFTSPIRALPDSPYSAFEHDFAMDGRDVTRFRRI